MNKIIEFQGTYRFLSNFYSILFVWEGITWTSSEHAYQAAKTVDLKIRKQISVLKTPGAAKRFGKTIQLRSDWELIKINIMEEIVREKFNQNKVLAKKLMETGDLILEEGNRWNDNFWGVCPPNSGSGQNHLGLILMKVRKELNDKN